MMMIRITMMMMIDDDDKEDDNDDIHKDINILSSQHTHGAYTVQYST
jgi:hypothetical protein